MNVACISGNLGKIPQLHQTANGFPTTDIDVAVAGWSKNKGKFTTWIRVRVLGKQAEAVCEYCNKGTKVWVQGEIQKDTWEKDGKKHYMDYILARSVEWGFDVKKREQAQQQQEPQDPGGRY